MTGTDTNTENQSSPSPAPGWRGLEPNDIVQCVPEHGWAGCLVVVDEVRTWGIQGFVQVPRGGRAYIRLKTGEFEPTGGKVVFVPSPTTEAGE